MISISERLQHIANYIPKGSIMADIGSDHAYLPCYVVQSGIVDNAIAGEVNKGPFQSANRQVQELNLTNQIDVRLGDGLQVIEPDEVSVVVIAGMGGQLIRDILDKGKKRLLGVQRLVLQPNVGAWFIREWLGVNRWKLTTEYILEEDEKIYEILVAERVESIAPLTEAERLLGPYLMKENNETFKKKWIREKTNWIRIVKQLEQALPSQEIEQKKQVLLKKINIVTEAIE